MNRDLLQQKIETIQQRLEIFWQDARELPELPDNLSVALEEVSVTLEELHRQQEELIAVRQQLELERQHYQELFEFAPDAYLVTTTSGVIQDANHAAISLLNLGKKFIVGKPLSVFVAKTDRKTFRTQLSQLPKMPQLKSWEVHLKPRKGEPFPATIRTSQISDQKGNLVGWRWLIRDMTEYKRVEEGIRRQLAAETELSHFKSRFIQTVSHEFRTPLASILICAGMIERYGSSMQEENNHKSVQKIRDAVNYMTGLLEDILIVNKAEAGKLQCNLAWLDLEQFCCSLVQEHQLKVTSKQVIRFNRQGECGFASLDEQLLRQILNNLLTNALKYSCENDVISFELTCQAGKAIFRIQDNGIGIPLEDQPRLFEPFHRAKNVGTIPGMGLGLVIVKKAVEMHGGAIAFESQVGVGTTFTVTLPLS